MLQKAILTRMIDITLDVGAVGEVNGCQLCQGLEAREVPCSRDGKSASVSTSRTLKLLNRCNVALK